MMNMPRNGRDEPLQSTVGVPRRGGGQRLRSPSARSADADLERRDLGAGDLRESIDQRALAEAQLRRPRRVVDFHDEPLTVELDGLHVAGDGLADRLLPSTEHAAQTARRRSFGWA